MGAAAAVPSNAIPAAGLAMKLHMLDPADASLAKRLARLRAKAAWPITTAHSFICNCQHWVKPC
jgi:hypothetical protein